MSIWHPYTQAALDLAPISIERGEGAFLYTRDGRRLIDAISSWWVNIHGHAHPAIAAAVGEQARKLEHVIFAGFTHEPAEELTSRLRKILPRPLRRIFFSDDGSTAVEVALKMAVQYWRNIGQAQRSKIVALENAYHGDTAAAMSVSADSPFTHAFDSMRFPVLRGNIENPEQIRRIFETHDGEIAAIIVEPLIQGAAGMLMHTADVLQEIRKLASEFGALFIADEVFTGFGRTGAMFACELAGVVPDVVCLSKGLTGGFLPMAATVCSDEVYSAFHVPDRSKTFFHGHSYTGNPLGCAAGNASLKIFETEPVFEKIRAIEAIHRERLLKLAAHPRVDKVRWLGDVGVLEIRTDDAGYLSGMRDRLYSFFIDRGVLLRPLGNIIYVLPPYVIAPADLYYVYDVILEALEKTTQGLRP